MNVVTRMRAGEIIGRRTMQEIDAPDDGTVIEALRRGDEGAFARLVDDYHARLSRIARFYIANRAVADEVVQDTWLGVIQGIWAFEGRSSLKTWIFGILINRAKTVRHVKDASCRSLASTSRSRRRPRSRLTASSPPIIRPRRDTGHILPPIPTPPLSVGSWPGRHGNNSRTPSGPCPSINAWF
jgi:RNA polymerase sigma-70 factor, ECF subfamily